MRAKIPQIKNEGWFDTCAGCRCEICKYIVPTKDFISFTTKRTSKISPDNLNRMSKIIV